MRKYMPNRKVVKFIQDYEEKWNLRKGGLKLVSDGDISLHKDSNFSVYIEILNLTAIQVVCFNKLDGKTYRKTISKKVLMDKSPSSIVEEMTSPLLQSNLSAMKAKKKVEISLKLLIINLGFVKTDYDNKYKFKNVDVYINYGLKDVKTISVSYHTQYVKGVGCVSDSFCTSIDDFDDISKRLTKLATWCDRC
ncbi:MAG: hypothetical protein MJZ34_05240 [Paludibacteraceae bacterium]|nr:hypothetical protein [Paludibacteraceae bacterium]